MEEDQKREDPGDGRIREAKGSRRRKNSGSKNIPETEKFGKQKYPGDEKISEVKIRRKAE